MSEEIYSFEEHRRRRDKNLDLVRCARCGKMILATATRCPECGVHFQGEAYDFEHPAERGGGRRLRGWVLLVAIVLLAALVVSSIGLR